MNLESLVQNYLEYLEIERGRSRKTTENYRHYLDRFLKWAKVNSPNQISMSLAMPLLNSDGAPAA